MWVCLRKRIKAFEQLDYLVVDQQRYILKMSGNGGEQEKTPDGFEVFNKNF